MTTQKNIEQLLEKYGYSAYTVERNKQGFFIATKAYLPDFPRVQLGTTIADLKLESIEKTIKDMFKNHSCSYSEQVAKSLADSKEQVNSIKKIAIKLIETNDFNSAEDSIYALVGLQNVVDVLSNSHSEQKLPEVTK